MKVLYPASRRRSPLPLTKAGHGLSGVPRPRYKVELDDLKRRLSQKSSRGHPCEALRALKEEHHTEGTEVTEVS